MSADDGAAVGATTAGGSPPKEKDVQDGPTTTGKRKAASSSPVPDEDPIPKRIKVEGATEEKDGQQQDTTRQQAAESGDAARHASPAPPEATTSSRGSTEALYPQMAAQVSPKPSSDTRTPSFSSGDAGRRRDFSQEEKKRGKRLFGGLLSTLSQTTASSQQKRRLEIERRQQDKAQQQRLEDDKRRVDRMAKLEKVRKIEQVRFEEQAMRTRHSHILAQANSLQTKTQPTLYYRPWQLTKAQEEAIRDQVRDAEELAEQERRDFRRRKELRFKELGVTLTPSRPTSAVSELGGARSNHSVADATDEPSAAAENAVAHEREREHDETGDVMDEAEEDMVIY